MAMTCAILRNKKSLDSLLEDVGLKDEEKRHAPWLLRTIVSDATLGGRVVASTGHSEAVQQCMRLVRGQRRELRDALQRLGSVDSDNAGAAGTMRGEDRATEGPGLNWSALPRRVLSLSYLAGSAAWPATCDGLLCLCC